MMSSEGTSSPVSASTLVYLMRWPVCLLIWLKVTFSVSEVAGKSASGHVTNDSFRKPFQFARGAILENSNYTDGDSIGQQPLGSPRRPSQHSGHVSPTASNTRRTAATASSGDNPGNGSSPASPSASPPGCGSRRAL